MERRLAPRGLRPADALEAASPATASQAVQLRGKGLAEQTAALDPRSAGYAAQSAALEPGAPVQRAAAAPEAEGQGLEQARARLATAATAAAKEVGAEKSGGDGQIAGKGESEHPLLKRLGHAVGLGLGVVVTEALRFVPGWNDRVVDAAGAPVAGVEGAARVGDHDLRKRHEEVVGPKILEYVKTLPAGRVHELLQGLGEGASQAPGASYRLEARASDAARAMM